MVRAFYCERCGETFCAYQHTSLNYYVLFCHRCQYSASLITVGDPTYTALSSGQREELQRLVECTRERSIERPSTWGK